MHRASAKSSARTSETRPMAPTVAIRSRQNATLRIEWNRDHRSRRHRRRRQDDPNQRAAFRMAQDPMPHNACGPLPAKPLKSQVRLLLVSALLTLMLAKVSSANATKCYFCLFQLARCTSPLDCYNQPDTCSNANFSPLLAQTVDCEFGCEQHVITDATGAIVLWQRGCAEDRSPRSSYVCLSGNFFFLRHEQCWCHTDHCNAATGAKRPSVVTRYTIVIVSLLATYITWAQARSSNYHHPASQLEL